jgi:hypothetical protein
MPYFLIFVAVAFIWFVNLRQQQTRIRFLSEYLERYQIEKLMEILVDGYLRAAGESDSVRRQQILALLEEPEHTFRRQVRSLAQDLAAAPVLSARFCTLRISLPGMANWWPGASADMRRLLQVHADGIDQAVLNADGLNPRDRSYRLTAEILLLQHSCHWFCRSRTIADGRAISRHNTPHSQLLGAVAPATRSAYSQVLRLG